MTLILVYTTTNLPRPAAGRYVYLDYAHRRGFLLLLAGMLFAFPLRAQTPPAEPVVADTSLVDTASKLSKRPAPQRWGLVENEATLHQVTPRLFDEDKLRDYRNNSDYQYDRHLPPETRSWWQRLKSWLANLFQTTLFREGTGHFWEIFGWIVAGLAIVYAILKFIGADPRSLFARKPRAQNVELEDTEANIHTISFEEMIADAVAKGQYKRAVRLFYLKSLKQLSDREWIDWQPHKTNYEYVRELKNNDISPDFRQVTRLFEYIWYGDFHLTQASFQETEKQFKAFEKRVNMT